MRSLFLAVSAIALLGSASAQDSAPGTGAAHDVFEPAFFERFAPRTALDMVEEVPGFQIRIDRSEARGLGQATDNVLINGRRISGKSNDVLAALQRIPADAVERIELKNGATLGIPGLSGQVVNVVAELTEFSGTWRWQPEFREAVEPNLARGEISLSGRHRGLDYILSVSENGFRQGHRGPERVFDAGGALIDLRTEDGEYYADIPRVSLGLGYETAGGTVMNFNAQYAQFNFDSRQISRQSGPGRPDRLVLFNRSEDEWNGELGGDIAFDLGPGRLELIGLQRVEDSPTVSVSRTVFADDTPERASRFARQAWESESIVRAEYSWVTREDRDWQISAEGAFNLLDVESALAVLAPSGDLQPVALPNSDSRVEERRAEANITHSRPLASAWSFQASLGAEYSELSQDGALGQTREFVRPKGFLALTYQPGEDTDVRLKFARTVGQISFFDFIASVDINDGNHNAGNPDLVPPQAWEGSIELTRRFGAYGSVTGRAFGERIVDIIDIIPIGTAGQGVGNLEQADRYGVALDGTFNLDPFGLAGAKFDYTMRLAESRLDDPLTGETRQINAQETAFFSLDFRHDIEGTDWAWGGNYTNFDRAPVLRLDQMYQMSISPYLTRVFVEHKNVMGARVNATLTNLVDASEGLERAVYVDRRDGPLDFLERRDRKFGPILTITISREF